MREPKRYQQIQLEFLYICCWAFAGVKQSRRPDRGLEQIYRRSYQCPGILRAATRPSLAAAP